jgi:hypothetical protein
MPLVPKTSLSAVRPKSPPILDVDSSKDSERAAPADPPDPPANPVRVEVLALAT